MTFSDKPCTKSQERNAVNRVLRTGEEGHTADGGPGGSVRIRRLHSLRRRAPVVRSFRISPPPPKGGEEDTTNSF